MTETALQISNNPTITAMINAWIDEKDTSHSHSPKTKHAYEETMKSFRDALHAEGLDVNAAPQDILRIAQQWASARSRASKRTGPVAPATYNQRLAILSSFYAYLDSQAQLQGESYPNPIGAIKKPKVQAYAEVTPLDDNVVFDGLLSIDTSTPRGKRDYALLAIGLLTGRRASELVGLRMKDVRIAGKKVTLHFDHCKGGKKMDDTLEPETARVFLDYLHAVYGAHLFTKGNDAPVWVSFSRRNAKQPISIHTLIDICTDHLGESKVHALRHKFAADMIEAGAPITELQYRLGHENITTTSIYTKRLRGAENPYASKLSSRFGIGKRRNEENE